MEILKVQRLLKTGRFLTNTFWCVHQIAGPMLETNVNTLHIRGDQNEPYTRLNYLALSIYSLVNQTPSDSQPNKHYKRDRRCTPMH